MGISWFAVFSERLGASLRTISPDKFLALIHPKCKQIVTLEELEKLVRSKKKLKVKFGIDPTGSEIHLGHAVPLMLMRLFQRAGHQVDFVIGDFTGAIGDPSGRTDKRTQLTSAEVARNMKTYVKQILPLIDLKKAHVYKNSSWLTKLPLADFFKIAGAISFGAVAQREDFRERLKAGGPVTLREANYASLMAIDSLHLKSDIEVGGIDQLLNFMQTRDVITHAGRKPEVILTTPLIEGTAGDGRKMSKSFNNYISLAAPAETQFGLVMSIPDSLLLPYFMSFADVYEHEIEALEKYIKARPFEAKKELAMLIVALFHGERSARVSREDFERKFSKKEYISTDEKTITMHVPANIIDALFEAFDGAYSKTLIRGLIEQGGVRKFKGTGQHIVATAIETVDAGDLIKVGKRSLFRFFPNTIPKGKSIS